MAFTNTSSQQQPQYDAESYDPMALYKQQQQEMLLQATQHVQESQEEIQQAQQYAASSEADAAGAAGDGAEEGQQGRGTEREGGSLGRELFSEGMYLHFVVGAWKLYMYGREV